MGWFSPVRRRPLVVDSLLGVALFVLALLLNEVGYDRGSTVPWIEFPRYEVAVAAIALTMLPIITRRRFPLSSLLAGATGLALLRVLHVPEYQLSGISLFFLIYSAGRWGADPRRRWVRAATVVGILVVLAWSVNEDRRFVAEGIVSNRAYLIAAAVGILTNLVFLIGPWVLGDVTRSRAEREADLVATNRELVATRTEVERRAVVDERIRIARELHDVVAHHVSVMGVQAGAARRVLASSPEQAAEALDRIEVSSRDAVAELQRLLGFLRSGDADPDTGGSEPTPRSIEPPAPDLSQLGRLQRQVAAAGLAVSLIVDDPGPPDRPDAIPPSVELSAYRIIQEGLTNALKHSGSEEATVAVRYRRDGLAVQVRDRGRGAGPTSGGGGNGLIGMRERASLHGGTLDAGPGVDGGFVVDAWLPFESAAVEVGR